jgi:hypothetical protein
MILTPMCLFIYDRVIRVSEEDPLTPCSAPSRRSWGIWTWCGRSSLRPRKIGRGGGLLLPPYAPEWGLKGDWLNYIILIKKWNFRLTENPRKQAMFSMKIRPTAINLKIICGDFIPWLSRKGFFYTTGDFKFWTQHNSNYITAVNTYICALCIFILKQVISVNICWLPYTIR